MEKRVRIGVIYCAWNSVDYLSESLMAWHQAKESKLGGNEFLLAAVSVPFQGFDSSKLDKTQEILDVCPFEFKLIDEVPRKETEARGAALTGLKELGVDVVIQVDSDEFYTYEEVGKIFDFVQSRPSIPWFRGSLKNYVFDDKTYLVERFCPPRIHRINHSQLEADHFWDDNNVAYRGTITGNVRHDIEFPAIVIPKSVAFTKHYSWLNDERSRRKIEYQNSRPGWECSFAWDKNKGLTWRPGGVIPETAKDS